MTTPDRPKDNEPETLATQNQKPQPVRTFPPLPKHLLDEGWDTIEYHVRHSEVIE